MKNLIIMLLLLLATVISAQNWTSLKTSDINLSSAVDNDIDILQMVMVIILLYVKAAF